MKIDFKNPNSFSLKKTNPISKENKNISETKSQKEASLPSFRGNLWLYGVGEIKAPKPNNFFENVSKTYDELETNIAIEKATISQIQDMMAFEAPFLKKAKEVENSPEPSQFFPLAYKKDNLAFIKKSQVEYLARGLEDLSKATLLQNKATLAYGTSKHPTLAFAHLLDVMEKIQIGQNATIKLGGKEYFLTRTSQNSCEIKDEDMMTCSFKDISLKDGKLDFRLEKVYAPEDKSNPLFDQIGARIGYEGKIKEILAKNSSNKFDEEGQARYKLDGDDFEIRLEGLHKKNWNTSSYTFKYDPKTGSLNNIRWDRTNSYYPNSNIGEQIYGEK